MKGKMNNIQFFQNEQWRWVVGYQNYYKVSNYGRVLSFRRKMTRILVPVQQTDGYLRVRLNKPGEKQKYPRIHQLVAEAFYGQYDKKKFEPHHINHVRSDNRVENLQLLEISVHRSSEFCISTPWNKGIKMPAELIARRQQTRRQKRLLDPNYDKPWSKTPKPQILQ